MDELNILNKVASLLPG